MPLFLIKLIKSQTPPLIKNCLSLHSLSKSLTSSFHDLPNLFLMECFKHHSIYMGGNDWYDALELDKTVTPPSFY